MNNYELYENLEVPKYYPRRFTGLNEKDYKIVGFDTETVNGYARMITDSDGNHTEVKCLEDVLDFLTRPELHKTLNTFFNLKYDCMSIMKYLDTETLLDLYTTNSIEYGDYKLTVFSGKIFTIKNNRKNFNFYDIMQYYHGSLDKMSQKYLGKKKKEFDVTNNTEEYFKENYKEMLDYCIYDSVLTKELTELMKKNFEGMGLSFKKPISKAFMAEQKCKQHVYFVPPKPNRMQMFAYNSYHGGRFELLQRGSFDKVYVYDINSAYPSVIKDLPDPTKIKYVRIKDIQYDRPIAFYKIRIKYLFDDTLTPLIMKKQNTLYAPQILDKEMYVTQPEIEYLEQHTDCSIEVLDGYYIYTDKNEKPFSFVEDLYNERKRIKHTDVNRSNTIKTIMNSIYGKFYQRNVKHELTDQEESENIISYDLEGVKRNYLKSIKTGIMFNPALASHITSSCRIKLLEACVKHKNKVIGFQTDSIITTKKFITESDKLGEWSLDCSGRGVFLYSGIYTVENGKNVRHKSRGIQARDVVNWFEELEKHRNEKEFERDIKHLLSVKEVIKNNLLFNPIQINTFINRKQKMDCSNDNKRLWFGRAEVFSDLLENNFTSMPLEV